MNIWWVVYITHYSIISFMGYDNYSRNYKAEKCFNWKLSAKRQECYLNLTRTIF